MSESCARHHAISFAAIDPSAPLKDARVVREKLFGEGDGAFAWRARIVMEGGSRRIGRQREVDFA